MKKSEAIALMETSIDIDDWNQKRDIVKNDVECEGIELLNTVIDQNGMCGKVLRKNKIRLKKT